MRPCSAGNSSPEWIKLFQRIADLGFGEPVSVLPRRPPRFHDNLRRTEHDAKLIDDGGFDVRRRQDPDGLGLVPFVDRPQDAP